jgi:hypothetical protein
VPETEKRGHECQYDEHGRAERTPTAK